MLTTNEKAHTFLSLKRLSNLCQNGCSHQKYFLFFKYKNYIPNYSPVKIITTTSFISSSTELFSFGEESIKSGPPIIQKLLST